MKVEGVVPLMVDEMLSRLGRWLRIAGYDVQIAASALDDRAIAAAARREGRVLISRDRNSPWFCRLGTQFIPLECNNLFACAEELGQRLPIDWGYRPFSRCSVCNHLLERLPEERLNEVPPSARAFDDPIFFCPGCGRIYWDGSHAKRMRRQIEMFARGEFRPAH